MSLKHKRAHDVEICGVESGNPGEKSLKVESCLQIQALNFASHKRCPTYKQ